MANNIIVTGGAGYIGSQICKCLAKNGFNPITIDNFSRGFQESVKWGPFYKTDLKVKENITKVFKETKPIGVIHLAAYAYIEESLQNPLLYYENNIIGGINLIHSMVECEIKYLVFSSSCTVYGNSETIPITEYCKPNPINIYGKTKFILENIINELSVNGKLNSVILRYFNVAGADLELETGELHDPETHLIPLAIKACVDDQYQLSVFGTDYPTPDGTCIRDYIHVTDLAYAHVLSLKKLIAGSIDLSIILNLGAGRGMSVMEIINKIEEISGKSIKCSRRDRRLGDPPQLVADIALAKEIIDWIPQVSDIDSIVSSAFEWYQLNA